MSADAMKRRTGSKRDVAHTFDGPGRPFDTGRMSRRLRLGIALGLLVVVGTATLRPAIAAAAAEAVDAEDPGTHVPSAAPTVTPYSGQAPPPPPYAAPPYGQYPPPGYAP